jgi:hypothetical protein
MNDSELSNHTFDESKIGDSVSEVRRIGRDNIDIMG